LTIAGVTKYVTIDATAKLVGGGQFQFIGSKKLKMTTFGITPPVAMFVAMTTADDVEIKFNITLQESTAQ
jgi:polyisoprenoid-binding protein YceI